MTTVYVAFGANLGDPKRTYDRAAREIARRLDLPSLRPSRLFETVPAGGPADQPPYINGCFSFETIHSAEEILTGLQEVEATLGRVRGEHWAARTIDLDLLLVGDQLIATPALIVPHPRMHFRRFALDPLADLNPDVVIPTLRQTAGELLERAIAPEATLVLVSHDERTLEVAENLAASSRPGWRVFDIAPGRKTGTPYPDSLSSTTWQETTLAEWGAEPHRTWVLWAEEDVPRCEEGSGISLPTIDGRQNPLGMLEAFFASLQPPRPVD
ncbi:2-amino-4-hydroxy-6-hydroxymethyldihydropteridine pyrophosphokinase [Planctomycetes bacterium Pan216]|uniref:2-amino-4-hydroxy-6-hydroxymethyldihydropteridine pyrophosphokinase n=1 Tax=Kolteria novifilia TaxID=2527975 RepID=A0A518B5Z7_9BACT|nr:2-amino-4-hydroxy-6-hydroxymethyldihydropteridine pyrophosphokinase [Planctomycetes bacterium Pan216]